LQPSPRALHQAARQRLNASFETGWLNRAPFASLHARFSERLGTLAAWPEPAQYDLIAQSVPRAGDAAAELPRFVPYDRRAVAAAGGYEQHVARFRAIPTRARDWHDFFNMAIWAHFPQVRWALNGIHVHVTRGSVDPRNGRTHQQNVAAQFDESGMIVTSSSSSLLDDLRALRFKRVFWERRAELLETTRFWVIGHGLLESLLAPHLALASKSVFIACREPPSESDSFRQQLDAEVSAIIRGWHAGAPCLEPIPVLGIPGYADNAHAAFYDDARYFRFQRRTLRKSQPAPR
jgi:hypothetical protein